MYLLDTNVVSAMRRPDRKGAPLRAWADEVPHDHAFVSVVTVEEIEQGVLRMERRDSRQGAALRRWLEGRLLPRYDGRILPVDIAVARCCAALHVPDPRPFADSLIAATAIVHDLTLATRNVRDFAGMKLRLLNPWDPE